MPRNNVLAQKPLAIAGPAAEKPKVKPLFRPTAMSLAMFAAGIIPGTHMIRER